MPSSLVQVYRCFGGTYFLQLQDWRVSQPTVRRKQQAECSGLVYSSILKTERQWFPAKCRMLYQITRCPAQFCDNFKSKREMRSPWSLCIHSCPCQMSGRHDRRIPQHFRWGRTSCTCQQTWPVLTFRWDSLAAKNKKRNRTDTTKNMYHWAHYSASWYCHTDCYVTIRTLIFSLWRE